MAEDPEVVAIANNELRHHAMSATVMLQNSEPLLEDVKGRRDLEGPVPFLGTPCASTPTVVGTRLTDWGSVVRGGLLEALDQRLTMVFLSAFCTV